MGEKSDMLNIFSFEKRLWKKYKKLITSINQQECELTNLSDIELKEKSKRLAEFCKEQMTTLDTQIICESFALVREASHRTLGLRHYDTQILGGLILNENKIAEMRTGEGKTLVATAPAFTNALTGKGVHIVTANEYLAQRDAEWMGQIYRFLGLNVGLVQSQMKPSQRRKNYKRDITYLTNGELGFDFLRDNLVLDRKDLVQRPFHYCIIDEVDSILIDEARTPLVISRPTELGRDELVLLVKSDEAAKYLSENKDYQIDYKTKNISLTNLGIRKAQILVGAKDLYSSEQPWIPYILNALKAKSLFLKDNHYIVRNNEIIIVDEFTGRIMEGRQWSDGLHGAVEAKENIYNLQSSEAVASITYQNFFRLYPNMAGMTGTAKTEQLEFENIYNLPVSVVPTFKPIRRIDLPDLVYMDQYSKLQAVAQECKKLYKIGRPVLVGTTTIQNSELISKILADSKIPHQILNAKPENIKREAEIIAQAGSLFSITIATNMAGRGTDILLGGNPEFKAYRLTIIILNMILFRENDVIPLVQQILVEENLGNFEEIQEIIEEIKPNRTYLVKLQDDFKTFLNVINIPNKKLNFFETLILKLYQKIFTEYQQNCQQERKKVLELGGLYVIGTERHESRRIDNQLRGRAGRQGDPGTTRFFLSLNDPLLQRFGGDQIKKLMERFFLTNEALESKFLSKTLDSAQQKVEGFYYDQRKQTHKYDRVLDKQRSLVYDFRKYILTSSSIRDLVIEMGESTVDNLSLRLKKKKNRAVISKKLSLILYSLNFSIEPLALNEKNTLKKFKSTLYEQFWSFYAFSELTLRFYGGGLFRPFENELILQYIDFYWSKHLENIKFLQDAVVWEAYAQKDPYIQYEERAWRLFAKTFKECRDAILYDFLNFDLP